MPSHEEALEWAAKIAVACRCPQEIRELLPDPTVGRPHVEYPEAVRLDHSGGTLVPGGCRPRGAELIQACETGEGAERLRGQKFERSTGDPQQPDPDNTGEGKSPRRSFACPLWPDT